MRDNLWDRICTALDSLNESTKENLNKALKHRTSSFHHALCILIATANEPLGHCIRILNSSNEVWYFDIRT